MRKLLYLCILILAASSLWAQVEPSATGGPLSLDDVEMMTPPPVSGDAYAVTVVTEEGRSNYLNAGLVFTPAYTDNIYQSGNSGKVGDASYSFVPTLYLNRRSTRHSEVLSFSPGFTIYQNTSELNGMTQQGSADFQFHLAKYTTLNLKDSFLHSSNPYNQANPFAPGAVSPTAQTNIFPFENQISNSSSAGINYQYARNAMIGASGSFSFLRYNDQAPSIELQDQNEAGFTAFFSRRLSRAHYLGVSYQFAKITTFPVHSDTNTNTVMGFFTIYLTRAFSLSFLGGPQHYTTKDTSGAGHAEWTPAVQGSVGWQGRRASIAGSYSRMVSVSSGLVGAYHVNAFDGGASWTLSRRWNLNFGGGYSAFDSILPGSYVYSSNGRNATGNVALTHSFSDRISAAVAYAHFHQGQLVNSPLVEPDSNRASLSISYQFSRPIGR